jgi:class 3 adenylate cyclase
MLRPRTVAGRKDCCREGSEVEPIPETRYAPAVDGGLVAYQAAGSGPTLTLGFHPMIGIDMMWEESSVVRFLDRLSSFTRHAWFDPRGQGSSSSLPGGRPRVIETTADDMVTVLDALAEERAVVLGLAAGPSLLFAATHPARTAALVLFDLTARVRGDHGYAGLDKGEVERTLASIEREWGTGVLTRLYGVATDERLQRWYGKCERLKMTPPEAVRLLRSVLETDLRAVLPTISVPTLVVARQRVGTPVTSRYMADDIDGAKYVEVPADTFPESALDAVEEFVTGRLPEVDLDRVLATVLFTDIVDSTKQATALGDRAWRYRLDDHDAMVRRHLGRFRGREIKTMGDGFLATFDGPARAIRCACAIRDEAGQLGIEVRAGLHTGEIELLGDDIGGTTVNIASRVSAFAGAAEVVVSRTVTDLVAGSGIGFEDRGEHPLKGVPGLWRLFAVGHT